MGTSGAWGGSGGRAWGRVRGDTSRLLSNPTPDAASALLPALSTAMDWLDADGAASDEHDAPSRLAPLPVGPGWGTATAARGAGARGSGGTASSGRGRGSGGSGARAGGGGRSRARAATVGGRVLAAGLAYERGDADGLRDLGLDLNQLQSLSSGRRMNTILNALVGADGGVEEMELRAVNSRVLRAILVDGLDGIAAVRLYIVEYVMQVYASEAGEALEGGPQRVEAERQVRSALTSRVGQLALPDGLATAPELKTAIDGALRLMRRLLKGSA